ncbi:hypothetical protein HK405_010857 [Cladochytrium tenue]|nr:hypothetical protein HK405_010857 [Cladochytrium tenue]
MDHSNTVAPAHLLHRASDAGGAQAPLPPSWIADPPPLPMPPTTRQQRQQQQRQQSEHDQPLHGRRRPPPKQIDAAPREFLFPDASSSSPLPSSPRLFSFGRRQASPATPVAPAAATDPLDWPFRPPTNAPSPASRSPSRHHHRYTPSAASAVTATTTLSWPSSAEQQRGSSSQSRHATPVPSGPGTGDATSARFFRFDQFGGTRPASSSAPIAARAAEFPQGPGAQEAPGHNEGVLRQFLRHISAFRLSRRRASAAPAAEYPAPVEPSHDNVPEDTRWRMSMRRGSGQVLGWKASSSSRASLLFGRSARKASSTHADTSRRPSFDNLSLALPRPPYEIEGAATPSPTMTLPPIMPASKFGEMMPGLSTRSTSSTLRYVEGRSSSALGFSASNAMILGHPPGAPGRELEIRTAAHDSTALRIIVPDTPDVALPRESWSAGPYPGRFSFLPGTRTLQNAWSAEGLRRTDTVHNHTNTADVRRGLVNSSSLTGPIAAASDFLAPTHQSDPPTAAATPLPWPDPGAAPPRPWLDRSPADILGSGAGRSERRGSAPVAVNAGGPDQPAVFIPLQFRASRRGRRRSALELVPGTQVES